MSRSLVAAKPIKLPKELEQFFDNPPLVGNERREDYDKLMLAIEMALKPADVIHFISAREFGNLSWEIRRERQVKVDIIKLKQNEARTRSALAMIAIETARRKAEAENPSAFTKKKREEKEEDPASFLAQAYMLGDRDIDIIDARIASYVYRRNAVLREIARYSEYLARKLEKACSDVIDGEFTEAAE